MAGDEGVGVQRAEEEAEREDYHVACGSDDLRGRNIQHYYLASIIAIDY